MNGSRAMSLLAFCLLTTGCGPDATPGAQLDAAANRLAVSAPRDSLESGEAQRLVRAWDLLHRVDPDGTHRRHPETEDLRELVELARRTGPDGGPSPAGGAPDGIDVARLSPDERATLARALEANIYEISERYRLGAADAALSRQFRAEAELSVLRGDLEHALGKGAGVPVDPLELANPEVLQQTRSGLQTHRRVLARHLALFNSPETRMMVDVLDRRIDQITKILTLPRYAAYHRNPGQLLKQVEPAQWAALAGDRDVRTDAELSRIRREFAAAYPRYHAAMAMSPDIRGPPTLVAQAVEEALRSYDLDVRSWSHAEARLRGLAREMHAADAGASTVRTDGWRHRVVSLLDEPALERARHLASRLDPSPNQHTLPAEPTTPYRQRSYALWREALDAEATARGQSSAPQKRTPQTDALITRELGAAHGTLTRSGEGELLATLQERFPRTDQMPQSSREDMRAVVSRVKAQQATTLERYVRDLNIISDRFARSTDPVSPELRTRYTTMRADLATFAQGVQTYAENAERLGISQWTPAEKRRTEMVLTTLGPRPPPDANPPLAAHPVSPRHPPGRGGAVILQTDPAIERIRTRVFVQLRELDQRTAALGAQPIRYSEVAGARVQRESALLQRRADWSSTRRVASQTRHPEGFTGLLADNGRPYHYQTEVKDFKNFRVVGGGIHLGDTLAWVGERPPPGSSLLYDLPRQTLRLITPDRREYVLHVEPDVLKVLYRFAHSGRNAAISIGWSGRERPMVDVLRSEGMQQVLLDPILVDTRIGRDLIRADLVPWRFTEPQLPNGVSNPFWREFARADTADLLVRAGPFAPLLSQLTPFFDAQRGWWANEVERSMYGYLLAPFLRARTTADALAEIRAVRGDLELSDLEPLTPLQAMDAILGALMVGDSASPGTARVVARLWAARNLATPAMRQSGVPLAGQRTQLAAEAAYLVGGTTLAVLMDEPTTARLSDGRLLLRPTLRYRYATRWMHDDGTVIALSHAPGDVTQEARTLPELTRVGNRALPTLLQGYEPLARVEEYAALAAFLRWAQHSRDLYLVDLGELAGVAANDGRRFGTPDILERER